MSTFLKNWKTTLAAVGIALIEIGKFLTGDFSVDWDLVVAGLAAIGLLFAGDGGKSK